MNKQQLNQAFTDNLIDEEKYKEELFKIETAPKPKKKAQKLPVNLEEEEFEILLKNTKQRRFKIAFLLGFGSGLRIAEVVALTPNDVDVQRKRISIKEGKGLKDRVVPLPKGFKSNMLTDLDWMDKYSSKKSAIRCIQIAFKKACKKGKLLDKKPTLHFHSLRHSFGTLMARKSIPVDQIRTLMGHSNIATTNIYLIANPEIALKSYEDLF